MATLIPHVLPCLRDHNSKIALSALEILELLVTRVAETTLRSYFKLLWVSIVERLGDNKLPVREKAVDVVVEISVVLDIPMILEKLKVCMQHKNWRTREQSLHAVWRCLERHNLFKEKKDVLLDDVSDEEGCKKLAGRCSKAPNSDTALPFLSQGIRSVRERLCEQVIDLRSSVSREACQAIQMLANTLRDDFNGHAEYCLGNLLKATYVTIQVISTAADTTVRSMIESTNSGYVRVIPK
ncbi:hypothetical protein BBJ29_006725 [Phytophthora kernoviae]|uniref:CLASP N-terminal domain-containing protein n=1 Tax=Phytophthora kernoviae TaxID=325452 RepID=A0A421G2Q7_9STRA|nr:hypothetical protein BBJ29_006725 [Phytophthora kernoviae]